MTIMSVLIANDRHNAQPEHRSPLRRWADRNSWTVFIAFNLGFWLLAATLLALA